MIILNSSQAIMVSFLVADTQLYKRLCPSVRWLVGRSVTLELKSGKTRISGPAHPSATDGRVSGLVLKLTLYLHLKTISIGNCQLSHLGSIHERVQSRGSLWHHLGGDSGCFGRSSWHAGGGRRHGRHHHRHRVKTQREMPKCANHRRGSKRWVRGRGIMEWSWVTNHLWNRCFDIGIIHLLAS